MKKVNINEILVSVTKSETSVKNTPLAFSKPMWVLDQEQKKKKKNLAEKTQCAIVQTEVVAFFLLARILGECWTIHFPSVLFFLFF